MTCSSLCKAALARHVYACDALFQTHLPGYIEHADELRAAGVQEIAVCCVNDPWVMSAWAKDMGTEAKGIRMLADPRCEFSQALGCTQDDTAKMGNVRSRRYSMVRSAHVPGTRTCKAHVSSDAGADCAGQRGQVPQRGEAGANCACCLPRRDALALALTCMHHRSLVCRWWITACSSSSSSSRRELARCVLGTVRRDHFYARMRSLALWTISLVAWLTNRADALA